LTEREIRRVSDSSLISTHLMMPQDANVYGNVFGGAILKLVDEIAGVVAAMHARMNVVTASIDKMNFFKPVYVGNLLILRASLNYVGRSSMTVGVRIEAKDLMTGTVVHTGSSFVTLVGLDEKGRPAEVPDVLPETEDEKRRYERGKAKRLLPKRSESED
jgi:acyl-CoA hydrolase